MIPWPALPPPPPTGGGAHDAAVVVTIEDYAFLPDVPGAEANGRAWSAWLRDTRGVPAVRTLRDADATRETVLEAVSAARKRVKSGGTVWVVFIGHGGPGGRLLGADAQATAASLTHRGLDPSELLGSNTVAVLDACYGAADLVPGLQPVVPSWADHPVAPPSVDTLAPPRRPRRTSTALLASRSDQVAGPLPGLERPAFSYLALGALRGWGDADGNGEVTASEVIAYADRVLYEEVTDRTQSPQLVGKDRVLGEGSEAAPRAKAEPKAVPLAPVSSPAAAIVPPASVVRTRPRGPPLHHPKGLRKLLPPWERRSPRAGTAEAAVTPGLLAALLAMALGLIGLALRWGRDPSHPS